MAKKKAAHGIFCLETDNWYNNMKDKTSVRPMLSFLENSFLKVPSIYRDVGTIEEFWYFLKKWPQKGYRHYPILYLGFHGEESLIQIGKAKVNLEDLAEILEDKCQRKIIFFGSCSTLDMDGRKIQTFLRTTRASAVVGYGTDVEWFDSAVFEMLALSQLQANSLTVPGIRKTKEAIKDKMARSGLKDELEYRIVVRKTG